MKKTLVFMGFFMVLVLFCGNMSAGDEPAARRAVKSFDQTFSKVWPPAGPPEAPGPINKTNTALESLNPGFEEPVLKGWTLTGEGFRVEPVEGEAAGGKRSLCFTYIKDVNDLRLPSFGLAVAALPAAPMEGKRIRLSAALKTRDAEGYVSLYLRAEETGGDPVAVARIPGKTRPRGTTGWKQYSIEMNVPQGASKIWFGTYTMAKGTVWADEFSLDILPAPKSQLLTINGKVTDGNNKPIPGALVTAKTFFSETTSMVTSAGSSGEFSFRLVPGPYTISASAPGFTAAGLPLRDFEKDVDVADLVVALKGEGFTIKGKINAPGGEIPPGTYIVANKLDFFGGDLFYARPQPDGSFQVTVPRGVSYKIQLDSPGLRAAHVVMAPRSEHPCILDAYVPQPAPAEAVSWIKQHAMVLNTPEPGQGFADLQPLKKIIGNARVVGLGETSHGTREIFQMKHRLFEFLVEEMGFTVFALECLWPQALAVNDYVLHGRGDPSRVLAGMYFIWDTEEVLALIKWMRAYNADPAHKKKIKFYGVDIQGSQSGANYVSRYLEKVDPDFAKTEIPPGVLTMLGKPGSYEAIYRYTEQECFSLKKNISRLLLHFDRNRETYAQRSSLREWQETRQLVRYLQQFVYHAIAGNTSDYDAIDIRDRAMAENIRWILDHEPPGTRIAYWAHNYHIALTHYPAFSSAPMGMYLQRVLGRDYFSIGFEFNRGSFQSRDCTQSQTTYLMKSFTVGSLPGSFGAAMSRTGIPAFLLDLHAIPREGAVHDWFSVPHVFKSINSVFANEKDILHLFRLPTYFDAVIFFDQTTQSRPNPSSPIPRLLY